MFRVGEGYDVHKLVPNRDLILGGVNIPFELGLLGHSDADVLLHAIMDSILGAYALGDIGKHFPDSDIKYKGISSLELLKSVKKLVANKKVISTDKNEYTAFISNIDATIICQEPKLRPYIEEMRKNVAKVLELDIDQINIKATTEEGLGFTGEKLGIAARSICLIEMRN